MARMLLSRIQQYYPPEKIKRIIGVTEMNAPLGEDGASVFMDPVTGQPMGDEQIIQLLSQIRAHEFDLVLKLAPATATERQAQFEQAVQMIGLLTASGHHPCPYCPS